MSRFERKRWKRAFRVRCRKCEHREFFELHPDAYKKAMRCESCGHLAANRWGGWRVDWYRTSKAEAAKQGVCECVAIPFPHRPSSAFGESPCYRSNIFRSVRAERARAAA